MRTTAVSPQIARIGLGSTGESKVKKPPTKNKPNPFMAGMKEEAGHEQPQGMKRGGLKPTAKKLVQKVGGAKTNLVVKKATPGKMALVANGKKASGKAGNKRY